ncbi:salicylate hydroxylase [Beauveria bassiana ARSEF 2860]|uniref:Salicylate hydroxylase n=1 Tax=Beauveria bassiana (strain ARSEF 2860) TaxID=655819 RepID=J4UHI5_BEAB2|nr:salicylate hydroxylase [Beauveria bassiana ARSEF 2860]EJP62677.1 salicylate hydroxylase [Beauveria bassiana ARSEF 2860]
MALNSLAKETLRVSKPLQSRLSQSSLPCTSRLISSATSPPPPRIAIVGGGPAGLTLGALLHRRRIPFTLFEYRPKPAPASWALPSGMLDLHEGDGLRAIRACGLYDEFLPLTGECSEEFVLADKLGARVHVHSGGGGGGGEGGGEGHDERARPEISRNNLTRLLLTRIPPESVRWGHKLQTAEYQEGNGVTRLDFGGGGSGQHEFDLVVGADGAWSRVRTLLTHARPRYSNTQIVTATIRHITQKYPALAALVGSGTFSALGDRHAVISQRGPMDSARVHVWLTTTDEKLGVTTGMSRKPPTEAKAVLFDDDNNNNNNNNNYKFLGGFGPVVKDLVATALVEEQHDNPGGVLDIRPLYALPYGTRWTSRRGLALIGDAAHVMLPNGEGVNQAMLDATLLAEAVAEAWNQSNGKGRERFGDVLSRKVAAFERDMTERALKVGEETDQLLGVMLGPDAVSAMVEFFQKMQEEQ